MSLPPGTRIPACLPFLTSVYSGAYWRGLVEGLTLGTIAGSIITACALALAWAHMGG